MRNGKQTNNPKLKAAVKTVLKDSGQENQNRMFEELFKARLLSPVEIKAPGGKAPEKAGIFPKGTNIRFSILQSTDEQAYLPLFTDGGELRKWRPATDQQVIISKFQDIGEMLLRDEGQAAGIVLNPFGDKLVFSRELVQELVTLRKQIEGGGGDLSEGTVREGDELRLSTPQSLPEGLPEALSAILEEESTEEAYFRVMERNGEERLLLVVDFEGEHNPLFQKLADASTPFMQPMGMGISFTAKNTELGKAAARGQTPFFSRQTS